MSVVVDSTGTEQNSGASTVTSISYTGLTIGSGLTNSAAVFAVAYVTLGTTNAVFSSPTWNGVSCPLIVQQNFASGGLGVALFGMVNPASGNNTFSVTSSVSAEFYYYGVSFSGVNQTGGTTTFAHSAGGTAGNCSTITPLNLTLTTANGNYTLVIGQMGNGNGTSTIRLSGVATQDWIDTNDPAGQGGNGVAGKAASSGTTAAWSIVNATSDNAQIAGVDIVAAAAGDTLGNAMQLMFV